MQKIAMQRIRLAARAATITALLGASTLLSATGMAAAQPAATYVLDPFACSVSDVDGNVLPSNVVPAGSDILIFQGWVAATRGEVLSFTNNAIWILTINGQSVDLTPYLTGVIPFGPFWGDIFVYDAGTLGRHQQLQTHFDIVLTSATYDGFVHWDKGSIYDGGIDCTVTTR
jgi:hypothetical protein